MEKAQEKYNQVMQTWSLGMLRDPNHSRLVVAYPSGEDDAKKIALKEARKIDPSFNKMEDGGLVFNEADELHNSRIIHDSQKIDDWVFSQKWSDDDGSLASQREMMLEEFKNKYGVSKSGGYTPDEAFSKYVTVDNNEANKVVGDLLGNGYSWLSFEAIESGDKTYFALTENQYNKIKDQLSDMNAVIDKYTDGGSVKNGDKEAVGTMETADGLIIGTVKWSQLWNKFQVFIDGAVYGEYNTLEDGVDELERAGFKNVVVQNSFVSAFDSTKKEMEGKTQQYRINSLIERILKRFHGINEVKETDGIVQTHADMYNIEPRRVASLFNNYSKKTNTDNSYMKDGGQVIAITDEAEWKKRNTLEKIEILSEHMPPKNAMELSRMSYANVMKSPWLKNKSLTFRPVETKKYKLGDRYSSDFDYQGMLEMGLKADMSWDSEKLKKLHSSFEDVNYHEVGKPLWDAAITSDIEFKKESLDEFHKLVKESLKDFEDEPSENETDVEIVKLQSVIDSDLVPAHIKEMAKALIEKKTTVSEAVSETVLETVPEPETESASTQYKKSLESLNMLIELADDEAEKATYKKSIESLNMLLEMEGEAMSNGGSTHAEGRYRILGEYESKDKGTKTAFWGATDSRENILEMVQEAKKSLPNLLNRKVRVFVTDSKEDIEIYENQYSKGGSIYEGGGEIIEIDEDGSNLPEALSEVFAELDEDEDPYVEMERLRVLANEKGYDFDYGLDGAPTEFWELDKMSKGGSVKKFPIAVERKINEINEMLPEVLEADDVAGDYHGGTMYSYVELTNPIEIKGKYVYLNAKKGNNQYSFEKRYNVNDTDEFSINGRKALMQDLNVIKSAFKKLVSETYSGGGSVKANYRVVTESLDKKSKKPSKSWKDAETLEEAISLFEETKKSIKGQATIYIEKLGHNDLYFTNELSQYEYNSSGSTYAEGGNVDWTPTKETFFSWMSSKVEANKKVVKLKKENKGKDFKVVKVGHGDYEIHTK